jgi:hypothetical protein
VGSLEEEVFEHECFKRFTMLVRDVVAETNRRNREYVKSGGANLMSPSAGAAAAAQIFPRSRQKMTV